MSKKKKSSSKNSTPQSPAFSPSAVFSGDRMVSQTYQDPTYGIVTKYAASPEEQQRQTTANQRINQILPTLGQTAPELAQRYDQMQSDYVGQQTDLFTKEYDKTMRGLREDVTSRFGTTNATPYYDKLTELERDVRAPALLDIQRTGSLYRKDLTDQEEARKLRELSALGATLSGDQNNFLSSLQPAYVSSQLINNWSQQNYLQRLQVEQLKQQQRAQATNSFLGFLGNIF